MRIKNISIALVLVFGLAVAGCTREAQLWNQSQEYEGEGYGDATRQTYARQIVNPDAAKPSATDAARDGERAILGIGKYKKGEVTVGDSDSDNGGGGSSSSGGVSVPLR